MCIPPERGEQVAKSACATVEIFLATKNLDDAAIFVYMLPDPALIIND